MQTDVGRMLGHGFEILGEENENRPGLHERNSANVLLQLCALVLNDTGRRQKSEREKEEHWNTDATEGLLETHCVEELFRVESADEPKALFRGCLEPPEIAGYIFKRKREGERKDKDGGRQREEE